VRQEASYVVAAAHPAMPGHFPGNAVVPAVVILDHVGAALAAWRRDFIISRISRAKFIAVLRPEESFTVTLASDDLTSFSFDCRKESGSQIASGEFLAGLSSHA
jgi:3-hydroxymyristoyl/3-hydroxydecanoyl-(acyl carrier protein) dehydratase